jgi:hypothetical protein
LKLGLLSVPVFLPVLDPSTQLSGVNPAFGALQFQTGAKKRKDLLARPGLQLRNAEYPNAACRFGLSDWRG